MAQATPTFRDCGINLLRLLASRALQNFSLDLHFLIYPIPNYPLGSRLRYLRCKYQAILFNQGRIDYLGDFLVYDNRFTPALLQQYPAEIRSLLQHLPEDSVRTVVDIGANIGQFAFTLGKFLPNATVFSFEPNPEIYPMLKQNAGTLSKWYTFPIGLGAKTKREVFYFVPNKSAQGSLFRENSLLDLTKVDVKAIEIEVCRLDEEALSRLEIPRAVDLLKVDVEGAEEEVLLSLGALDWKYLWIEISDRRGGAFTLASLFTAVKDTWGQEPKLLFQTAKSGTRNILLTKPSRHCGLLRNGDSHAPPVGVERSRE